MKKIPTIFVRDHVARPPYLRPEITPGCEWVLAGEGEPTRKYDGTCCLLDEHGQWWGRREVKPGKTAPPNYFLIEEDPLTGKQVGWEPIAHSSFHGPFLQALGRSGRWAEGTYELCGPKINGNPEGCDGHVLYRHATAERAALAMPSEAWEAQGAIGEFLRLHSWEGLVWHHPDGRMAKIKARDFPRPA